jgi:hypothetical protein
VFAVDAHRQEPESRLELRAAAQQFKVDVPDEEDEAGRLHARPGRRVAEIDLLPAARLLAGSGLRRGQHPDEGKA